MAWFIVANKWKQPKCSSTGDWKSKLWYIHTLAYYTATKEDELVTDAMDVDESKNIY